MLCALTLLPFKSGHSNTSTERKTADRKPGLMLSHGYSPPRNTSPTCSSSFITNLDSGSPTSLCSPLLERAKVRPGLWRMGHQIGKGSFGTVHIGLNDVTGDLIAVKVLTLSNPHIKIVKSTVDALYREIQLMRNMNHENIVRYLGAELQADQQRICIFQEWVPGSITSLLDNFGPFGERRIVQYTKQILHGLVYLHGEGVMHRDIKGSNILIDDKGVVKLCDFGASKVFHSHYGDQLGVGDHTRVGSPLFMAPEVLLKQEYGISVDIWSLGGAVLQMKTGTPPWSSLNLKTPVALIQWIRKCDTGPPLPEDSDISPALRAFLGRCFIRDPTKRPTARELLSDPFLDESLDSSIGTEAPSSGVSDIETMSPRDAICAMQRVSCLALTPGRSNEDGAKKRSVSTSRRASSPESKRSGISCVTDPQKTMAPPHQQGGMLHSSGSSSNSSPHPMTPLDSKGRKYMHGGRRSSEAFGSPTHVLSPTGEACFTPGERHNTNPYSTRKQRSMSLTVSDVKLCIGW